MAYTPVKIYQGQPGTGETTIVSAITGNRILKQLIYTNTNTSSASVISISLVPSAGAAGSTNRIIANLSVAAGVTGTIDMSQVMTAGDFLSAIQSVAGAVTFTISGVSF